MVLIEERPKSGSIRSGPSLLKGVIYGVFFQMRDPKIKERTTRIKKM